jgi:hypothetical protein
MQDCVSSAYGPGPSEGGVLLSDCTDLATTRVSGLLPPGRATSRGMPAHMHARTSVKCLQEWH